MQTVIEIARKDVEAAKAAILRAGEWADCSLFEDLDNAVQTLEYLEGSQS